jgi:hypothetical protein
MLIGLNIAFMAIVLFIQQVLCFIIPLITQYEKLGTGTGYDSSVAFKLSFVRPNTNTNNVGTILECRDNSGYHISSRNLLHRWWIFDDNLVELALYLLPESSL